MAKNARVKHPRFLYVVDDSGDPVYLDDAKKLNHDEDVAVYELVRTGRASIDAKVVDLPAAKPRKRKAR